MASITKDTTLAAAKALAKPASGERLSQVVTRPKEVFPTRLVLPITWVGAIGHDVGEDGLGVLMGLATPIAPGGFIVQDGSAYTDQTTEAGEATANDMDLWPATPAPNDAIYFLHGTPFCGILVNFGTAAVGANMTVVAEYYNGSAWVSLASTVYSDNAAMMLSAATGSKLFSFVPPSAWRQVAVSTGVTGVTKTGYAVRFRCTAYTALTTPPKGTQAWVLSTSRARGMTMPMAGVIEWAEMRAQGTPGATTASRVVIINANTGESASAVWTAGTVYVIASGLGLRVGKGDEIWVKVCKEHGTTEPINVQINLGLVAL